MPPLVSIVGKSKSGKTTLIERLIGELKLRGYRVATIKHVPRNLTLDKPDKDSWRHIEAGSEATAISSPERVVLIKPVTGEASLDGVVRLLGEDYDIILTEGFKDSDAPKIETHRREAGTPLRSIKKVVAIVTDEPLDTKARQFSFEDVKGLADFVEEGFIKPQRERVSLYVNGVSVPLSAFPKEIISNTLVAMASSLRGVGEIKSLEILLRRETG